MLGLALAVVAVWLGSAAIPPHTLAAAPRGPLQDVPEIVLDGELEVIVEDSDRGSRLLHFLLSEGKRISLRFRVPPGDFQTGTRVRVRGRWDADMAFVVTAIERRTGNNKSVW